jgi:23S rRNA pseudouridine1911/1915/1917 synthase
MLHAVKQKFTVGAGEHGQTLAAVLRKRLALPWTRARRLVERGKVTIAGAPARDGATRLRAGQAVAVDEAAPTPATGPSVQIVYEDAHVVVIDKPTGVSSVPYEKRETGTAMDLLREAWRKRGRRASERALHVVHRIDKDTSGLLAFATTRAAERGLQALFRAHDVERSYLCVAHGVVKDMRVDSRLVTDRGDGLRGSTRQREQGKRAITHVRVVETLREATLCEVRLETGKTHQIRIHLAESGHPLVGETVYIRDWLRAEKEPLPSRRLLLHAATLGFTHPITGARVQTTSALPADFLAELERLR